MCIFTNCFSFSFICIFHVFDLILFNFKYHFMFIYSIFSSFNSYKTYLTTFSSFLLVSFICFEISLDSFLIFVFYSIVFVSLIFFLSVSLLLESWKSLIIHNSSTFNNSRIYMYLFFAFTYTMYIIHTYIHIHIYKLLYI